MIGRWGLLYDWIFPNGCFLPKIGVPQNVWFIIENPIKIHDLGGPPLFLETPKCLDGFQNIPMDSPLPSHVGRFEAWKWIVAINGERYLQGGGCWNIRTFPSWIEGKLNTSATSILQKLSWHLRDYASTSLPWRKPFPPNYLMQVDVSGICHCYTSPINLAPSKPCSRTPHSTSLFSKLILYIYICRYQHHFMYIYIHRIYIDKYIYISTVSLLVCVSPAKELIKLYYIS